MMFNHVEANGYLSEEKTIEFFKLSFVYDLLTESLK